MADVQSGYPVEFGYFNRIVQLPPATDDQIAVVEARFGELPTDYRYFLKTVNGGRPSRTFIDVPGWSFDIECFNGVGGDPTGPYAVERRSARTSEVLDRQVVAIAGNGAGDQLIFLSADDPAVYQWIHDEDVPPVPMAPSFTDLLAMLREPPVGSD
jgi:hypothetical protein